MNTKHPIQPISKDENGTLRFKRNAIVKFLLDNGGFDLNKLAVMGFSREDREQFAQLIGYSLSGFSELSYVSDETYGTAEVMAEAVRTGKDIEEWQARIETLENIIIEVRKGLKIAAPAVFRIHPDDLDT